MEIQNFDQTNRMFVASSNPEEVNNHQCKLKVQIIEKEFNEQEKSLTLNVFHTNGPRALAESVATNLDESTSFDS